ncbi:MAG: hypothetical protein KAV87_43075, partial [Desulfobacteraceae bacterium]|nr:hypothetical protein [Desulfobacteraceae bacterium]
FQGASDIKSGSLSHWQRVSDYFKGYGYCDLLLGQIIFVIIVFLNHFPSSRSKKLITDRISILFKVEHMLPVIWTG